ncbi:hypothetical protein Vretimale_7609 [Volvox reticuliferus]|uniref:Uncharacterized protein n=1 Tax=Volvox reticuliferus TaxID=1737510 RepID=A0A8J4G993_9CHLO|nr:hypothetical protein Vretifemale_7639 [Volvox reticuliferus]GIM02768.1 hypothetical protein Vretimale_7609 [Volvox reticuliferus]
MPSLNLLVVGEEKSLPDFEDALESCKRYVGPIKLFSAHKAVDGVSRLQKLVQTCGQCHAAFLSHHFTCPGKEEFSETLRKVIKEKYPDVPVICWGNSKKGGELNKHFHATLEFSKHSGGDVNTLVDILKQVQAGQIRADYLHKDQRKSLERRNSLERTDSIRGATRTDSILRRVDSRRASAEGSRPSTLDRTVSSRRSMDDDGVSPSGGAPAGIQSNPTLRRKSMERKGSLETHGNGGLGALPHGGGGSNGMGMGTGMGAMRLGSMSASMGSMGAAGIGMGGMGGGVGSLNAGMGMGMTGMGMGMGAGVAQGMMNGGINGGGLNGLNGMTAAGVMPQQPSAGISLGMGNNFGSMRGPMGVGTASDMTAMMGNMSLGGNGGGAAAAATAVVAPAAPSPNADLIRMLAEEVVRLRKAVEEKRARDAEVAQLRELQQQHMMLQQQLAAVGGSVRASSAGGGMPMGI